ncbi:hypothetical protein BIY26_03135 [Brenneria goodwinii]|uniref:Uncharacterized protein n=1 Tax=Brenneria goodwinii TaxID=1109412 RepID=A0A0G4JR00_9GAMM|nr:hypothetical protein AWC36_14690 [Brenneria goodwinii]RLM16949.1 hypothetical protein BIY28_22335 [Brenneria goodwinii]RLM28568.1 hypothetical protein BIY26_03135 [Brenneria goodwinii]CPR14318.1 hypothetical protein BN1221_00725 [Brenneria goodwinii]
METGILLNKKITIGIVGLVYKPFTSISDRSNRQSDGVKDDAVMYTDYPCVFSIDNQINLNNGAG